MKKILITGALGQDGSYLSEYALSLGHEVHGITRGVGDGVGHYVKGVCYHAADMRDELALENVFRKVWPDEIYNLAAQVFVPTSWSHPEETFDVNVGGLTRLLKLVDRLKKTTKVYQASSSEMFGTSYGGAANEFTEMSPVSPYGVAKLAAHKLVGIYRDKGLFVVGGILFNHESPRRGEHMVTRKITKHVAKWVAGSNDILELGNLNAVRDWGHAKDYVRAMYLMLQQSEPADCVVGSGVTHSVGTFLKMAIECAGIGTNHCMSMVKSDTEAFARKNDLWHMCANATRAHLMLKWEPEITFNQLVFEMVEADICKNTVSV